MSQTEPVEPQEPQEPQEPAVEPAEPDAGDAEPTEPAEPGEPDAPAEDGETDAGDSEPAAEPPEPPADESQPTLRSEAEIEKAAKQVDQLRKSVANRVGSIFGDDANFLVSCPLCAGTAPGWLWPPSEAPLPDEQVRAVFTTLGVIEPKEYQHFESYQRCEDCEGLGSVKTGSRVPGFDVVACPTCAQKGYIMAAPLPLPVNGSSAASAEITVTGPSVIDPADADDPAVAELRRRGFTVVPPIHFPG